MGIPDGSMQHIMGHYYGMLRALDRADSASADAHAEIVMQHFDVIPNLYHEPLRIDVAYYLAMHKGEAAEAQRWLDEGMPSILTEDVNRLRAQAACALAAGDHPRAADLSHQALDLLASYGPRMIDPAGHDWLTAILTQAQSPPPTEATP
jgi:hypothetical protein